MTEKQEKEIEHHLITFPDRHQDAMEMKKEWIEFKTRTFWTMVALMASLVSVGVWVGIIQTNVEAVLLHEKDDAVRFVQIESRINSLEVTNSEIRARLTSIEVTLQEIKAAIIKIR